MSLHFLLFLFVAGAVETCFCEIRFIRDTKPMIMKGFLSLLDLSERPWVMTKAKRVRNRWWQRKGQHPTQGLSGVIEQRWTPASLLPCCSPISRAPSITRWLTLGPLNVMTKGVFTMYSIFFTNREMSKESESSRSILDREADLWFSLIYFRPNYLSVTMFYNNTSHQFSILSTWFSPPECILLVCVNLCN